MHPETTNFIQRVFSRMVSLLGAEPVPTGRILQSLIDAIGKVINERGLPSKPYADVEQEVNQIAMEHIKGIAVPDYNGTTVSKMWTTMAVRLQARANGIVIQVRPGRGNQQQKRNRRSYDYGNSSTTD